MQLIHHLHLKVDPADVLPPRGREEAYSEATQQLLQLAEANKSGTSLIAVVIMAGKPRAVVALQNNVASLEAV